MRAAATLFLIATLAVSTPAAAQERTQTATPLVQADAQPVVEGINRFSLELYQHAIASSSANLFLSPVNVSTAVALAYRGARGTTADELRATLHYPVGPLAYLTASAPVLHSLDLTGAAGELRAANAIWVQSGLPLEPDFVSDVAAHAQAGLHDVDYRADHEDARRRINSWVATETHNKIRQLLGAEDVNDRTRAMLVSSLYWKGRWASPFENSDTKAERFTTLNGRAMIVPMMHQRTTYRVSHKAGVKAILLPYGSGEIAMLLLVPDLSTALPRFEQRLTSAKLSQWIVAVSAAPSQDTALTMPSFHLGWRGDLVPMLNDLGAGMAFTDEADFSGMAREPYPGEIPGASGLKIQKIIHQTTIDVDENGSEAAAATAIAGIVITGTRIVKSPPFILRADKPFIFLLLDTRTNMILFMGRYVAPEKISGTD